MSKQLTVVDIRQAKGVRKLTTITAYDYPLAKLADQAEADMILVGDSLAMVVLGREDTLSVTMEEMLHHIKPVAAAASHALVIGDMPFASYQLSRAQAVENGARMLAEGGARAVKVEGANHVGHIRAMVDAGIPVQGHIGLTPQSLAAMGGFKVQGKTADAATRLADQARELEEAGCFSIVVEAVPPAVGQKITEAVNIPTIGIGAGPHCDGQVLVIHDILGLFDRFVPKFVKRYANISQEVLAAIKAYKEEVESGAFPGSEHCFAMDPAEMEKMY